MPSRRPPSQRDPAYALHRLPAAVKQVLPGTTVRNATPVKQHRLDQVAAASSWVLGYADVQITFPFGMLSNDSANSATAVSFTTRAGDVDLAVTGGNSLHWANSGTACIYLVTADLIVGHAKDTGGSNLALSVLTQMSLKLVSNFGRMQGTFFGSTAVNFPLPSVSSHVRFTAATSGVPTMAFRASDVTTNTYDMGFGGVQSLRVTRLKSP